MGALWCLKGAVALKAEKLQGSSVLDPQLLSVAGAPRTEHCFSGFGFLPEHFASPDSSLTFSNFPEYLSLPPSLASQCIKWRGTLAALMRVLQSPY